MAIDWKKVDAKLDLKGLQNDVEEATKNPGQRNYKEVPLGNYEVKIEKMELTESKKGAPMLSVWFGVLNGEYKGSKIFMNQVCNQGFQIGIVNEFLRSLDSDIEIPKFTSYDALNDTILDVYEAIDGKLEYGLKYSENKKGFKLFEIVDVFDAA